MEKKKCTALKRKFKDDPLDDSFDFFLPNKLKEKSMKQTSIRFSKDHRNNGAEKLSSSASSTSSTHETYDSDMENVKAVCLSRVDPIGMSNSSRNKDVFTGHWKEVSTKMKRQTLLLTRTTAEREAILTEKLGLILLNENGCHDSSNVANFTHSDISIFSEVLIKHWCKLCRLWSFAKQPSNNIKDFYIASFSNYVDFNSKKSKMPGAEIKFDLMENYDNIDNNSDAYVFIPSEEYTNQFDEQEVKDEKSSIDIFETTSIDEKQIESNVPSSEGCNVTQFNYSDDDVGANIGAIFTPEKRKFDAITPDVIELSPPTVESHNVDKNYLPDSQQTLSPVQTISSISTERLNDNLGMLDRIGVSLLAQQWENLFTSNNGDTIVYLENEETLKVYKFVLTVRCPQLISEISDDDKLNWNMHSLEVAKAFFRYVYSGKCDHLWQLKSAEKNTVKRLAQLYQLSHLQEVLTKFHSLPNNQLNAETECLDINQLNSCNKLSQESVKNSPALSSSILTYSPNCKMSRNSSGISESSTIQLTLKEKLESPIINCTLQDVDNSNLSSASTVNIHKYINPIGPVSEERNCFDRTPNSNHFSTGKKSLGAYFQDSFPDLPDASASFTTVSKIITSEENYDSDASTESLEIDKNDIVETVSISSSSENSPLSSPTRKTNLFPSPTTSTVPSLTSMATTPSYAVGSSSSSEILFSKNATPFPNYDDMITPQLKKELNKFGLKGNLAPTKAKLILKYIYDQTHPVVESPKKMGKIFTEEAQTPDSDNTNSLITIISKLIKSNIDLYTHILLFKPIWLEKFHQFLKENGIVCSPNDLKDVLNELCITYRTKNTRTISNRKSKRKK